MFEPGTGSHYSRQKLCIVKHLTSPFWNGPLNRKLSVKQNPLSNDRFERTNAGSRAPMVLTVPTPDFVPSCSQPKSPTMNFMISYHFYGSKECLCKIFSNFVFGKGLIFALKVWDCSKKQEQASAHEGDRTQPNCLIGEHPYHYPNSTLVKYYQKVTEYNSKLF